MAGSLRAMIVHDVDGLLLISRRLRDAVEQLSDVAVLYRSLSEADAGGPKAFNAIDGFRNKGIEGHERVVEKLESIRVPLTDVAQAYSDQQAAMQGMFESVGRSEAPANEKR